MVSQLVRESSSTDKNCLMTIMKSAYEYSLDAVSLFYLGEYSCEMPRRAICNYNIITVSKVMLIGTTYFEVMNEIHRQFYR